MGNRADDEGTDVEICIKPLTGTVHADTPTGAPEKLLALLDSLGFERKTLRTAGPVYVWHEAPDDLTRADAVAKVRRRPAVAAQPGADADPKLRARHLLAVRTDHRAGPARSRLSSHPRSSRHPRSRPHPTSPHRQP